MRRLLPLALAACFIAAGQASADGLKPFVKGSWATILAAHRGRPTVIHFWGMACAPCRVEMPHWGAYIAAHPDIDMVTIDTDALATDRRDPEAFLRQAGLGNSEAWRFDDPFVEKLFFSVDPNWQGEIPLTLLITRSGAVSRQLGAMRADVMEKWLASQK